MQEPNKLSIMADGRIFLDNLQIVCVKRIALEHKIGEELPSVTLEIDVDEFVRIQGKYAMCKLLPSLGRDNASNNLPS